VTAELRDKLKLNAVMMQIPIGLEAEHQGVVDLVSMKAYSFEGDNGELVREVPIPAELESVAAAKREQMLDAVSMFSDELMEAVLEGNATEQMIHEAVRRGVLALELVPVYMGSAYKNKGVQRLLDAVTRYLPSPLDVDARALDLARGEAEVELKCDREAPLVSLAFKLEDGPYGQLTYVRVYQGSLRKGASIVNSRTKKRHKVGRLVRMHSNTMEDIDAAGPGDIVALFGIDCASGDSFTSDDVEMAMTSMFVPDPVISLAIKTRDTKAQEKLARALGRFTKEDPTFRVHTDEESGDTIVSGMGELHLEVYMERIKREYKAEVDAGMPQVAYREAITQRAEFDYVHKKQTGGSGQYGRVAGYVEPNPEGGFEFVNEIHGGAIPREFIPSVEKGFKSMLHKGELIGFPVVDLRVLINDGTAHSVDSSDNAFQAAARGAFKQVYRKAKPVVLEPIMKLAVEGPSEFQGAMVRTVMGRRGLIIGTNEYEGFCRIEAEVPLATMFGYSTELRSGTQGQAEFTMEFARYAPAPKDVAEELIQKAQTAKQ
jgi:elongation factor G